MAWLMASSGSEKGVRGAVVAVDAVHHAAFAIGNAAARGQSGYRRCTSRRDSALAPRESWCARRRWRRIRCGPGECRECRCRCESESTPPRCRMSTVWVSVFFSSSAKLGFDQQLFADRSVRACGRPRRCSAPGAGWSPAKESAWDSWE